MFYCGQINMPGHFFMQVLIGKNDKQKNVVGFFNCTHLHAPEGKSLFVKKLILVFCFFLR